MNYKILTVDDSKTVRIIIKKAFRCYDCVILEAASGVEGLAVAAKNLPDLILLDVTMPVMDGVEMLTRLKADPALKGIPVIMLTAEGGRDHVIKIAKLGVRDYIIKPFKDEVLIEKCSRVLDLKPLAEEPTKSKTIFDTADILVVDDKPAIVQQITEGLKHTPWKIRSVGAQGEAIDACSKAVPDLIVMSLSLPGEVSFGLFRLLRADPKTKYTPVVALAVKSETAQQQQAQSMGFTAIVTKPIDPAELESKIAKAMNLDTSQRYYAIEDGCMILRLPENSSAATIVECGSYMKTKFVDAIDSGLGKLVIDGRLLGSLDMNMIKFLLQVMQSARELGMRFAMVGTAKLIAECKGFEDTRDWTFHDSTDEAKRSLGAVVTAQAA